MDVPLSINLGQIILFNQLCDGLRYIVHPVDSNFISVVCLYS